MRLTRTIRLTLLVPVAVTFLLAVAPSANAEPLCNHRNEFEQDVGEKKIGCRSILSTTGTVQEDALYPDANAVGSDGRIMVERQYWNQRAYFDAWREVDPSQPIAFDSWASGWLHDFERSVVVDVTDGTIYYVRPDGENTQTFQPLPSFGCTPFDILLNTYFGGDYYSAVKMQIVGSCAATSLDEFELWIQETDGAVWKFAWSFGGIYRPYEILRPSGYALTFHYFEVGSTVPECAAPAGFEAGRLCQIRGSDSATVRLTYYDPSEPGFEGRGGLRAIEAGPTPMAMATRALYSYTRETREVADCTQATIELCETQVAWNPRPAQDPSRIVWLLTGVTHQRHGASGWQTHSSEAYEYTIESYYNPTANGQLFGYDTRQPIRVPFIDESLCIKPDVCAHQRAELWLLRRIRRGTSTGDALVRGHEYTACGLGATDEKSGGYEWLGYDFDIAPTFECDHKGFATVSYFDESSGEQRDYRVDWDEAALMEVSDECGCSAAGMIFERSSLQVFAKTDAAGIRTTYAYDTDLRPLHEQVNWDGDPDTPPTSPFPDAPDNGGKPVRLTRYEYAPNVTAEHTVESRVFSAACETRNPEFASYSCTGYSSPPAPSDQPVFEIDYDPDTAGGYNDTASATRRSRERMGGWTAANASSQVLVRQIRETRYEYAGPRLTAVNDPLGNRAERTYHATGPDAGRLASSVWDNGSQRVVLARYSNYDAEGRPGRIIDENDAYQVIEYDLDGRIAQVTSFDADNQSVRERILRYNENETLRLAAVGPPGGPYVATLNADNLPAVGDVCNQQDSAGEPQFETGLADCISALAGLERDVSVSRGVADGSLVFSAQSSTELSYAGPGGVSRFDTYDGNGARFMLRDVEFDDAGREARQWRYTSSAATPAGVRDFEYDERGLRTRVVDPRYADVALPGSANLANANRIFTYNAFEELVTETVGAGTADEATATYDYDSHGNLSRIVDGEGRATAYLYDDFGSVIAVESPDTGRTTFAYNLVGQTTEKRHADGQIVSYAYDTRYRLLTETYPGTSPLTITYHYDTLLEPPADASCPGGTVSFDPDAQYMGGRLAAVVHDAGATYYSYDSLGQATAVYEQLGPVFSVCELEIVRYGYDAAGRLTSVQYPSGLVLSHEFEDGNTDPTLYPASLTVDGTPLLSGIDFNPLGVPAAYVASALTFSGAWNLSGEPGSRLYETSAGDDLFYWDVSARDGNGNVLLARDHVLNQRQDFFYDNQDRVSTTDSLTTGTETVPRGKQSCIYDYDRDGNRINEQCHEQTVVDYSYDAGSSRLDALEWQADPAVCTKGAGTVARPIHRDDRGRATSTYRDAFIVDPAEFVLTYGALGRLTSVDTDGDLLPDFEYAYNHQGMRREKRQVGTGSDAFTYDLQGRLLSEKLRTGQRREYIYLGDQIVAAVVDGAGIVLVGSDHLTSPRRGWSASTGELSWALDFEAFGSVTAYGPSAQAALPTRFPGQYYDEETGLHYNGYRYYEPATGRYISADPIGQRGGLNVYAYADNRPTTMIDPLGLTAGIPPGFESVGTFVVENFQEVSNTVPDHVWGLEGTDDLIVEIKSETIVENGRLVKDRIVAEFFVRPFRCV